MNHHNSLLKASGNQTKDKNKRDSVGIRLCKRYPLAMYFFLAFAFTWLILCPGVAATLGWLNFEFEGTVLTIVSGIGPLLAAILVTGAIEGKSGVRRIFGSMFTWQVKARWWAASIGLLAGLFAIATALSALITGDVPDASAGIYLNGGNVIVVVLLLLFGSFGEEPGWRGFALPRLLQGRTPLKATLILTLFWWLWHLPTYWTLPLAIKAVEQYGFVAAFGIQFVVLLVLSLLCTWVYNGSGGVVLMPVLLHASWNFWSGAFGQEAALFLLPLLLLTVIVVGFATRGKLGFHAEAMKIA
jgi:membrane protease YdiL (CAAX protease family)